MKRDIKYIIKRVIIGILIGLFFIMFKSCNVKALTSIDTEIEANVYFQTQYCEVGDSITGTFGNSTNTGNRFNCTKGPSYHFAQYLNNDTNTSVPFLLNQGQLINNMTFKINFDTLQEITSSNRYVVLRAPWVSSTMTNNDKSLGVFSSYVPISAIKNNQDYSLSPSISTFFNQPQYCSYENNNGDIGTCQIILAPYSSLSRYLFFIDIPVGTSVKSISMFFGNSNIQNTYDLFTGVINNDFRAMTSTRYSQAGVTNCNSSYTNYQCYKTNFSNYQQHSSSNFNIYGSHFYSGAGLVYYYYPPNNPIFDPSNQTQNVFFESSYDSSTNVVYNYSSFNEDTKDYYNNLINNINEEINPSSSTGFFDDFYEGFTTSSNASGFISLFNNMFLYPLQKLRTNASIDLVRDNINGDKILNNHLCMKNSQGGLLGAYNPYQVQFYRDYKFNLPCPHTEIYTNLKYGDYAFYPSTFMGASLYNGGQYNFADIWLTIQHGFLVYLLFVNCLNIYKYVLDSKKTEIEVLEL